jgi:hypothetical protein
MEPPPSNDDNLQPVERLQLTAEETREREKELLYSFETSNVQMVSIARASQNYVAFKSQNCKFNTFSVNHSAFKVVTEDRLVRDKCPGDDEVQKNCLMVHLPDRKPLQPDLVPNNCAICLESFAVGEIVVWSNNEKCQHSFHQDCILEYLVPLNPDKDSPCPCCRQPFCVTVEESPTSPNDDVEAPLSETR